MVVAVPYRSVHEGLLSPIDIAIVERHRAPLIATATGHVLELGGGRGENFRHYGPNVEHVEVVGSERRHRGALVRAASDQAHGASPVQLLDEPIDGVADASCDTVVATFVLCAVADVAGTLAEVRRVLRPAGTLLFFDHVPPHGRRSLARVLVAPAWSIGSGGCDLLADVVGAVRTAGFFITTLERVSVPTINPSFRSLASGRATVRAEGRPTAGAVAP